METFDKKAIDAKLAASFPFIHRWHNRFHLEMPFGLINDPNGMTWHEGKYHIFYQWNPLGCEHKNKCWAHVETRDFIHYSQPELSLWPDDVHDKDGCYSGCGLSTEKGVEVVYTCNRKEGDVRIPAQRVGILREDGRVEKGEILIEKEPAGYTGHFRDPFLFKRQGKDYMLIGAQREDETGTVLLYEKKEGSWKRRGEIQNRLGEFGYMWECPNLLQFGTSDALVFCPQGLEAREFDRQNRYQAGYIAGHLSVNSCEMIQHTKFQELDRGFDFYAPQVMKHEGRNILIGWMGMPEEEDSYPTVEHGWIYSLTMPRELRLRNGHIYSRPVRELKELRVQSSAREIELRGEKELFQPLSEGSEILLNLAMGEARRVEIALAFGLEKLTFTYDRDTQVMEISREGMKLGSKGKRCFKLFADDELSLQLFVDRTAVEAFFQHGEEAASLLVFPEKNILPELELHADHDMSAVTGTIWSLDAFQFHLR